MVEYTRLLKPIVIIIIQESEDRQKHEREEKYLTSKLTSPLLWVSKASNRKCAYILESKKEKKTTNQNFFTVLI